MNIGARLRTGREARGLSVTAVAEALRVQPRFISAIEENDWRTMPPRPYGRGFVRAYAAYVGENPEQTVRDYFAQFAPAPALPSEAPPREPSRRPAAATLPHVRRGLAAAVLIGAIGGLALFAALRDGGSRSAPPMGGVGAVGTAAPIATGTGGTAAPSVQARTTESPVSVAIEATAPAWVTASVDGRRVLYRTMAAGEREMLRGRENIALRVGDAGAIRWQVNGAPAVVMGRSGAVKSARVTPPG